MSTVQRPETDFNAEAHAYALEGKKLPGISTIAKIGDTEAWGVASAWGFRIGYEGAWDVLSDGGAWNAQGFVNPDELRAALQKRGLTPWSQRDKAAERGNWVHDVLEGLGQKGEIPDLSQFSAEVQGHARGVLQWFLDYRPEFVATEVQVTSTEHHFAGRYDIRCKIRSDDPAAAEVEGPELCLVDLKTSKDVYPTTHFVQLEGYELAGVEMGFPATDARYVLNTKPDGTYKFVRSYATAEHFLAYLGAHNAVVDIQSKDPEVLRKRAIEVSILDCLSETPRTSKWFADSFQSWRLDARGVGFILGSLRKRGKVEQPRKGGPWQLA